MALRVGDQGALASGLLVDNQTLFVSGGDVFGSGVANAQNALVSGAGTRGVVDLGTPPEIDSQGVVVNGVGEIIKIGAGVLLAQPVTVNGVGAGSQDITGTGAAVSQSASVSATGEVGIGGSGALQAQSAAVAGVGGIVGAVFGSGSMQQQSATVAGVGARRIIGNGAILAQQVTVFSAGGVVHLAVDYACYLSPYTLSLDYPAITVSYQQQFTNTKPGVRSRRVDIKTLQRAFDGPVEDEVDYEFSNGRKFTRRGQ